ncbi:hypothetical protein M413DRAFT_439137 [Hebeloma cylindrosporum]|uniref:Thioredoxin domain-containing protein n=1 Tax=Hebeloma cylindrosporum TaxID=76867 RepID=A0A0C2Z2J1_HEBCY|nr:hypothetical protein M413DRAFT_439137 [Hebeloma cylindrosporum h7]
MPLYIADGSIDHITLKNVPEEFVIFYSSIIDGEMWCPDCRLVEKLVKETFPEQGPEALIVYVGNKPQWKNPLNIYRQEPWKVTSVPTIVRLKDGKELGRLSNEVEILEKLTEFVGTSK